jgi:hypothetical protein
VDRAFVKHLAAHAVRQDQIAKVLRISAKTLRAHYRLELDQGAAELHEQLVQDL